MPVHRSEEYPGHPGAFIGTWIQLFAVVVAVVAGIADLTVRNRQVELTNVSCP